MANQIQTEKELRNEERTQKTVRDKAGLKLSFAGADALLPDEKHPG
jgi:hypothetical protein